MSFLAETGLIPAEGQDSNQSDERRVQPFTYCAFGMRRKSGAADRQCCSRSRGTACHAARPRQRNQANASDYPDAALDYVEVMREFAYSGVDTDMTDRLREFGGALFTVRFAIRRPRSRDGWLYWRPHCHFVCSTNLRSRVKAALLCLQRICSRMSCDVRDWLLVAAFGAEKIRVQSVSSLSCCCSR